MLNDEKIDDNFCCFCQDALPHGRVLIVVEGTQRFVANCSEDTGYGACSRCGMAHTGQQIGINQATGEVLVAQFEHFDYRTKVTEEDVARVANQYAALQCVVCDEMIFAGENQDLVESATDFAIKTLRMYPMAYTITATCAKCDSSYNVDSADQPPRNDE